MRPALISLDIGSSGARASVFLSDGRLLAASRCAYPTSYPKQGWAEQDANRWAEASIKVLSAVAVRAKALSLDLRGLALTGTCPTYVPVDGSINTLGPALTYQDNRSGAEADELADRFGVDEIRAFAGNSPRAFYILPEILWHKRHDPALYDRLAKALQPSDFVIHRLTGELVTSTTHASGTLAFDIRRRRWNDEFVASAGLKAGLFPARVADPWDVVGTLLKSVARETGLPADLPVVMGAPDSQCCALGVGAVKQGALSNMSGTSTCLDCSVDAVVDDPAVGNWCDVTPGRWSVEVGLNTTGGALDWFARVALPDKGRDRYLAIDKLVRSSRAGAGGVLFMPYLTGGERDSQRVKGGFHNLGIEHGKADMLRAVLEGVAFAERQRIELLTAAGCHIDDMRISGGGAKLDVWNQIKADVTGLPVMAVTKVDAAELGAAMLAGIGVGMFADAAAAVESCQTPAKLFTPRPARVLEYQDRYQAFRSCENALAAPGFGTE